MSHSDMNLDKALRTAMIRHGIDIAPAPGLGPFTLHYNAHGLEVGDGSRTMVTITLKDNGMTVTETSGIYALGGMAPSYPSVPEPHQHSGPAMSSGEPMPIGPLN